MSTDTNQAAEQAAPAAAAEQESRAGGGMSLGAFTFMLVWPLVVAGVAVGYMNHRADKRMVEMINTRPDVAVVDDIALIKLAIDNGADRYNPASVMTEIGRIVDKNNLENTILLSQSMILYAPPSNRIRVSPNAGQPQPVREIGK